MEEGSELGGGGEGLELWRKTANNDKKNQQTKILKTQHKLNTHIEESNHTPT